MRHGKKFNHLGRKKGHREALLMNLAQSLVEHKRINTTLAKAKALRKYVEPILTKAKENTTHSRRMVFSDLQSKESVKELFEVIAEKIVDRPGGYCRILKTGFRQGDGAEMAMIELVDFNTVLTAKTAKAGATRRGRRRGKGGDSGTAAVVTAGAVAATVVPDIVEDVASSEEE
ncbi:MAG: 50S ribosomal protein L17 [Saprospiraceae bacterium]